MIIPSGLIAPLANALVGQVPPESRLAKIQAELRRPGRPVPRPHLLRAALFCLALFALCFYLLIRVNAQESSVPVRETPTPMAFKATIGALSGLAVADTIQSVPCLNGAHCREANPLYKQTSPAGFVAIKAGGITALSVLSWKLHKRHPALAWTLIGSMTAVQGWAVAHNARALRNRPPK